MVDIDAATSDMITMHHPMGEVVATLLGTMEATMAIATTLFGVVEVATTMAK